MGLFNLFKKKDRPESIDGIPPSTWLPTPPPVYNYDRTRTAQNSVAKPTKKAESKVIEDLEKASDLASIAKVLAENKIISKPKDKNHNTFGEDLRHLTADGELPFGWVSHNKDIVEQIDSELSAFRNRIYEAKDKQERLSALQSYFQYLEDGKKHYYLIGECAGKYFEEYAIDSEETRGNKRKLDQLKTDKKA